MFVAFYPQLQSLNIMHLATPQSAILSAIIFNALIIVALIPLALRGAGRRGKHSAAQSPRLRARRDHHSFHWHQAHRPCRRRGSPCLTTPGLKTNNWLEDKQQVVRKIKMIKHLVPAIMLIIVMTLLTGLAYPLAMTGLAGRFSLIKPMAV